VAEGLRQQVLDVAEDLTPALGFAPTVSFSGLVDLGTSPDLADDVTAVVRETLTNVRRHAHATSASVGVEMTGGKIRVTVVDDGIGCGYPSRSSGIANLLARAVARGGTFTLAGGPSGGTVAMWTAETT
jgi:signal transduction histidine kinase